MYDTIIIGAGMSGLAAGIRLAYFGQSVCILERHNTIGGLNSFYRMAGRDFDVGLHAVTNFTQKGEKKGPLGRLLRQLRFKWDEFALCPQLGSKVMFPGVELKFDNDIQLLRSQIAQRFPKQVDNFDRLRGQIIDYDDITAENYAGSARTRLAEIITDPLLIEMLLCPLMWYGNAREQDMDWGQFCIMFRSIYMEGFARPLKGVRLLLKNLVKKYRELGGELKLRTGVSSIKIEEGNAVGVTLDDGRQISGRKVISSAGWWETMRMCEEGITPPPSEPGRLSFVETISVIKKQPVEVGYDSTIVFFNDSPTFHWVKPEDDLCDVRTGVICSPNNFDYQDGANLDEGFLRVTALANYDRWTKLPEEQYRFEKNRWYDLISDSVVRFIPEFRRHVVAVDMFTPKTIHRYTWHKNGAVYGAPEKHLDGTTHLENLYICGTDQGYVGIIGSIMSGVSVANRYCLKDAA